MRLREHRVKETNMRSVLSGFLDMLAEAWGELWRARPRSLLAVAGIAAGAAALTFPVLIRSAEARLMARQQHEWLTVSVPLLPADPLRRPPHLSRKTLLPSDAEAIRQGCTSVESLVVNGGIGQATFKVGRRACLAYSVECTDAARSQDLAAVSWDAPTWGRTFTSAEIARGDRVVIINPWLARQLFAGVLPPRPFVRVNGVRFRVVGVAPRESGRVSYGAAVLPAACAQQLWVVLGWGFRAHVRPGARGQAISSIDAILSKRLGDPGSSYVIEGNAAGSQDNLRVAMFLGLVGLLTLLSAGIAISGKSYVDVLEQVHQIALRRALGASALRIYGAVLFQGGLLAGLGGLIGGGLGALAFAALDAKGNRWHAGVSLHLGGLLAILLWTIVVGMVAALQAATLAVRANPAEALARKDLV